MKATTIGGLEKLLVLLLLPCALPPRGCLSQEPPALQILTEILS